MRPLNVVWCISRQPQLRQHRVRALDIRDVTVHAGFPVTSPARTLIDCAARAGIDELLNEARVQRLVTNDALHAAMARCPGRAGTGRVRARPAAEQGPAFDRSPAERILRRIIEQGGLAWPQFNGRGGPGRPGPRHACPGLTPDTDVPGQM